MRISEVRTGNYNPSFGIYRGTEITKYGKRVKGRYKKYNIDIFDDKIEKAKMFYITDDHQNWLKYKLVYLQNGVKHKIINTRNL